MSAITMTVAEALAKADEYEALDAISTPAKAARVLAARVRELEETVPVGKAKLPTSPHDLMKAIEKYKAEQKAKRESPLTAAVRSSSTPSTFAAPYGTRR